jgi:hypothetical protein
MTRILFVNKFSPLSNAVTGKMADELATYLIRQGHKVEFVSIRAKYRAKKNSEADNIEYPIHQLSEWYSGDHPLLRFIFSLFDGFRMFMRSLILKKEVIIVMTEPPLLFFWFQLFRFAIKAKLVYWTMDVYPEAFAAGKFIKHSNVIYRFFKSIVYRNPPDLLIALGAEQWKFLDDKFQTKVPGVIFPCGLIDYRGVPAVVIQQKEKILFGYSGNLGAAHDSDFLLSLISQLDPSKHQILLSLYGTKAEEFKKQLLDHTFIQWQEVVSYDEIAGIDINIASLLPEWNHVSVPSKAVTAICCGSTLLLNSTADSDNWKMFEKAAWRIAPAKTYDQPIACFLADLTEAEIKSKSAIAKQIAIQCLRDVQGEYQKLNTFLESLPSSN